MDFEKKEIPSVLVCMSFTRTDPAELCKHIGDDGEFVKTYI